MKFAYCFSLYEGKDAEDRIHLIYDCDRAERDLKSGVLRTMRLMCEREGEELLPEGRIHLDPESGELTTVSGSTMMGYGVYNTRKPDKKRRMDNVDVVYVLYTEFVSDEEYDDIEGTSDPFPDL